MRGGFNLRSGNEDPKSRMVWPKTNKQNPEISSPGQEKNRWGGTEGKEVTLLSGVDLRTKLHFQGPFVGCAWDNREKAEVVREPFPVLLPYSPQAGGEGEEGRKWRGVGEEGKEGKKESTVQFSKITGTQMRDSIKGGALMGSGNKRLKPTQRWTDDSGWLLCIHQVHKATCPDRAEGWRLEGKKHCAGKLSDTFDLEEKSWRARSTLRSAWRAWKATARTTVKSKPMKRI